MDLFNDLYNEEENLLPKDGNVKYCGKIRSDAEAYSYYKKLL